MSNRQPNGNWFSPWHIRNRGRLVLRKGTANAALRRRGRR